MRHRRNLTLFAWVSRPLRMVSILVPPEPEPQTAAGGFAMYHQDPEIKRRKKRDEEDRALLLGLLN